MIFPEWLFKKRSGLRLNNNPKEPNQAYRYFRTLIVQETIEDHEQNINVVIIRSKGIYAEAVRNIGQVTS